MVEQATETQKATETHDVHIYMPTDAWEKAKELADYAADEGIIEGHARGNLTGYISFALNLAERYLREYALKKRGFK